MKKGIISLILFLFVSCSPEQPSDSVDLESLSLNKDLITTADNKEVLIGNLAGLAMDRFDRLYVADTKIQKIHIFSSEGTFLESIGREGKGPGEFENLNPNIKVQSDRLYVLQNSAREIDLFDINTFQHVKTISIAKTEVNDRSIGIPDAIFPLENGNMLIVFTDPYFTAPEEGEDPHRVTVSEINDSGEFVNKNILQLPALFPTDQKLVYMESGNMSVFTTAFYPDIEMTTDNKDNLIIGRTDNFELNKYNINGELIGEFRGVGMPVRFTISDLDSIADYKGRNFKKAVNEVGAPEYWPSFERLIADDVGRYWLKRLNPGKDVQTWQIINNQGDPVWKVDLPATLELFTIKENKAYGIYSPPGKVASIYRYTFDI